MNGPQVNVLAKIEACWGSGSPEYSAVADLIEQMRDVMRLWDSDAWSIDGRAAAVQCRPDKWRAALERAGGAP